LCKSLSLSNHGGGLAAIARPSELDKDQRAFRLCRRLLSFSLVSLHERDRLAFRAHSATWAHKNASGTGQGESDAHRGRTPPSSRRAMPKYVCGGPGGAIVAAAATSFALPTTRVFMASNDPSSATRPTGRVDCNRDAMAGFAAAPG